MQGMELMKENERLKQQVLQISDGPRQVAGDSESIFFDQGYRILDNWGGLVEIKLPVTWIYVEMQSLVNLP
ncbi:hypothetical protein V6N11_040861 [Hibiscus sabdariffa]|uniref:Uncharacterized protein n=1 Tax=Hibiscus sabdariffa TaxID=183260 RepID=A0ABR2RJ42_9ROSI